jgi:hypothetical protein
VKTQVGPFLVSTVFVPNPCFGLYPDRYETAVFDHRKRTDMTGHNDEVLFSVFNCEEVEWYETEELAKAGHEKWVERVKGIESLDNLEGEWK